MRGPVTALPRGPDFHSVALTFISNLCYAMLYLLQYPRRDNGLMATGPLVVELTLGEVSLKFGCLPFGIRPNLA